MAFITTNANILGDSIPTDEAESYIFELVIFNDWRARDIQRWEYVLLGPFLGKNFASSLSPWIVTLDALESLVSLLWNKFQNHCPIYNLKETKALISIWKVPSKLITVKKKY